jgi:hypothetical protein
VDLVVTIDTEADDQWQHGRPLTCENVSYWPAFQRICQTYGVTPTYLVTSEMAQDRSAAALLAKWTRDDQAEVGAHLHVWSTAPFVDAPGLRFNDPVHLFESSLTGDLLRAKLQTLTTQITKNIGVTPRSYRAGRFGIGRSTVEVLGELGYLVDSSVTPLVAWGDESSPLTREHGPDFRHHTAVPFRLAHSGDPGVLELPVTVVIGSRVARAHPLLTRAYLGRASQVARKLGRRQHAEPMWLRPLAHQTAGDLVRVWNTAEEMGLPSAVMMFHSSELMPGGSPHRPTRRSITALLATLDQFFRHVLEAGGTPATLSGSARRIMATGVQEKLAV